MACYECDTWQRSEYTYKGFQFCCVRCVNTYKKKMSKI